MKVILTQDVRGQGKKGQLIDAAEGYARNFLLPRKLAVLATADAINTMNLKEKARRAEEAANRQAAVEMGGKLKNVTVKLTAKGGKEGKLFGSVTAKEIAAAVQNIAPRIVSILCCNVSIRLNQLDHVALQVQNVIICLEARSVR